MGKRFQRLRAADRAFLAIESPEMPMHVGALAVLEAGELVDEEGGLRLDEIRARLAARVAQIPELRKVLYRPGPPLGAPLWVDDPAFSIERHVRALRIPEPGNDAALITAVEVLVPRLLDRRRPLWEMWFLSGLSSGRVAMLIKIHHALADGMAAVALVSSLFDLAPDAPEVAAERWTAVPPPRTRELFLDNLARKAGALGRAIQSLAHPRNLFAGLSAGVRALWNTARAGRRAPRTSLNAPIEIERQLAFVRLTVAEAKEVARAHGEKVNDVVLAVVAGGLRSLLSHRGEPLDEPLLAAVAMSRRLSNEAVELENVGGELIVPLPLDPDPAVALKALAASTRAAKHEQASASVEQFAAFMAASGLGRLYYPHQHRVNVFETDLIGPPARVSLLGSRILELMPITLVAGNVTLSFCAFSYAGRLTITVTADAARHPDLPILVAGMESAWAGLAGAGLFGPKRHPAP